MGDFADPFVLRHDGRYYLYCTNPDVRCWSSTDLMTWRLEGPTIEPDAFPGLVPFAPEVVYSDGAFFMYTSPSGHGHFVLRSDSPTGPFRPISVNVGHTIDGNVLIDDDGRWYFYWAGDEGIWGCEMASPTEFGEPVFTGIHMNGWTEGAFVSKRDGVYHMTLTGNHYLSPGYRIDAAFSSHPLRDYRGNPLNPIVIGADGPNVGLGHSSSVRGPDLVSTYMVYHNLNHDESRDLDIDRQVWSGRGLQVLGPTTSAPVPSGPDLACDWATGSVVGWSARSGELELVDGAGWLTGPDAHAIWTAASVGPTFTVELNLTPAPADSEYGLTLGDALILQIDRRLGTVSALRREPDAALASGMLPSGFDHDALHCWRLVAERGGLQLFLDGRLQLSLTADLGVGPQLGVFATVGPLRIGHCAMTSTVAAVADRTSVKPVPGRFWASLGEYGDAVEIVPGADDAYDVVRLSAGSSVEYRLHVQRAGRCTVYLAGEFSSGDALVVTVDDREYRLRVDRSSRLISVPVDLAADASRLTVTGIGGAPVIALVTIAPVPEPRATTFEDERAFGFGKRALGGGVWDDVAVMATVSVGFDGADAHADLLVRASQFAEGGEGDDTCLGIDFFLGYSIQLHRDRVVLARHDYDERVLATHELSIEPSVPHQVSIRALGGTISVAFNGQTLFHVDDALSHAVGHIGIRTSNAHLHVEEMQVVPEQQAHAL